MESAPDDILISIFTVYTNVHHLNLSPTSLLSINKRIHSLVLGTPTLWSSFRLNVRSLSGIRRLLENGNIERYLQHSEGPGLDIDLDIDIVWHNTTSRSIDHMISCNVSPLEVFSCPMMNCQLIPTRQAALVRLIHVLMGASEAGVLNRYTRWRSLQLNLKGVVDGDKLLGEYLNVPVPRPGFTYEAPRLTKIILSDSFITLLPVSTTNLRHLEVRRACLPEDLDLHKVESFGYAQYSRFIKSYINLTPERLPSVSTLVLIPDSPLSLTESSVFPRLRTISVYCDLFHSVGKSFHVFKPNQHLATLVLINVFPLQFLHSLISINDWSIGQIKLVHQHSCSGEKRAREVMSWLEAEVPPVTRHLWSQTMSDWRKKDVGIDITDDPYFHKVLEKSRDW
ncbi:hypothetical protein FRB91_008237 [Serendipita sp. 411]|nr:hypothetical protein FRC16_005827 [Serendipita sp. 398]KAG8861371.1 hypothetical protein FRB91_008237 [Serendipita sp. 411]